jgi:hypothetical protein
VTRYHVQVEVALIFEVEAEDENDARAAMEETWTDHRPVDVAWGPDVTMVKAVR